MAGEAAQGQVQVRAKVELRTCQDQVAPQAVVVVPEPGTSSDQEAGVAQNWPWFSMLAGAGAEYGPERSPVGAVGTSPSVQG